MATPLDLRLQRLRALQQPIWNPATGALPPAFTVLDGRTANGIPLLDAPGTPLPAPRLAPATIAAPQMRGAVAMPPAGAAPGAGAPSLRDRFTSAIGEAFGGLNDPTLSPEENHKARNAALLQAGLAMLAASGPSTQPVGLGQILAGGAMAGQQGGAMARQQIGEQSAAARQAGLRQRMQTIVQSGAGLPQLYQLMTEMLAGGDHQGATALATVIQAREAAESKGRGSPVVINDPATGRPYVLNPNTGQATGVMGPNGLPLDFGPEPIEVAGRSFPNTVEGQAAALRWRRANAEAGNVGGARLPSLQVVQTADGLAAFNPQTGMLEPITGQNGAQVKPKSTASAVIVKAAAANRKQMSSIDTAIADLQAHPSAIGLTRFSDAVNQRVDPGGVKARAGLADIGSMIIHDRSGAAVTAKEFPRLSPFIPSVKDTPQAALIKLRRMKQILQEETSALQTDGNYSPDNPFAP